MAGRLFPINVGTACLNRLKTARESRHMTMAGARLGLSPGQMWNLDASTRTAIQDMDDHLFNIERDYLNGHLTEEQYQRLIGGDAMGSTADVTAL